MNALASAAEVRVSRSDRIVLAGGAGIVIIGIAIGWMLLVPPAADPMTEVAIATTSPGGALPQPHAEGGTGSIVVDVEGAVVQPGVHELPAGSRLADALAAAGGYSTHVDLDAAAASLNLARPLADGEQIRVPAIGEAVVADGEGEAPAPSGGGGGPAAGAMVNLNTASPEELEALPGIGPVTVQKIVAARQEQPFSSLQDAVTRGVINRGQLEDITGLATAG